jgi:hypothetical protein
VIPVSHPIKKERITAKTVPTATEIVPVLNKKLSPTKAPKAKPRIGNIKGATSMAPIITAVLFDKSPKVAIMQELIIKIR